MKENKEHWKVLYEQAPSNKTRGDCTNSPKKLTPYWTNETRLKGIPTRKSRWQPGLPCDAFDFPNQAPSFVLRNDGLNSGLSGSVTDPVDLEDRE
jgi:hypothetical protein